MCGVIFFTMVSTKAGDTPASSTQLVGADAGKVCDEGLQDECCCEAWLQHLCHDSHALGSADVSPISSVPYIEHEHQ